MDYQDVNAIVDMKCREGCVGEYELREVTHTVRYQGKIVVIDKVPAEICTLCGDVLLTPDTVRQIERLLRSGYAPNGTAPVYDYVSATL